MRATTHPVHGPSLAGTPAGERLDGLLLRRLAARIGPAGLRYAIGHSTVAGPAPVATFRFRDRRALAGLLLDPEVRFGDAYADGRIEIEGDLVAALEAAYRAPRERRARRACSPSSGAGGGTRAARVAANVHRHYDLGNDFYALWLDEQLRLHLRLLRRRRSCRSKQAQVAKMDHVCRKLRLRPGETRGRGRLRLGRARAAHGAALRRARPRLQHLARADRATRASARAREGLADRVEFVEDDYRDIRGRCDAFVSVGMLEHVGPAQLRGARPRDRAAASTARTVAACSTSSAATGRAP